MQIVLTDPALQYEIKYPTRFLDDRAEPMRPDLELIARIIAENVASAFERGHESGFEENERELVVHGLMRELLRVLPAGSNEVLTYACNRHLSVLAECGMHGPRVAAVDPNDGSVTMREG